MRLLTKSEKVIYLDIVKFKKVKITPLKLPKEMAEDGWEDKNIKRPYVLIHISRDIRHG